MENKIILVKRQWLEHSHDCDSYYDSSHLDSQILGYFSKIETAWIFILERVKAKYGAFDDYVIVVSQLDPNSDQIKPIYQEEQSLSSFKRSEEAETQRLDNQRTKSWKCSRCDQELPNDNLIASRKNQHETKHTRGKNFKGRENGGGNNIIGDVTWIRIYHDAK